MKAPRQKLPSRQIITDVRQVLPAKQNRPKSALSDSVCIIRDPQGFGNIHIRRRPGKVSGLLPLVYHKTVPMHIENNGF